MGTDKEKEKESVAFPKYEDFSYKKWSYNPYAESDQVKQAYSALQSHLQAKPGEYSSQWQAQLDDYLSRIQNREDFSYDVNGDALYQQYKDLFTQQGKMAMQDTMGQASALAGGYGSSYASTAGNQAYQASLQNLGAIVPELAQMAYDRYNQEGQELYNQYGLLLDREATDYGRHRDTVSDWYTEASRLQGAYDGERTFDYSKYSSDRAFDYGVYSDDRTLAYGEHTNKMTYAQQLAQFQESQRQYNEQMAFQQAQFDWQREQANKVASSGGGGGGGGGNPSGGEFKKATFARTDDKGNNVFIIDGKEYTFAPGINPYTGTKNSDIKNGAFNNGYQPNNIGGKKLSKSGITDVVNGVTQNVWKTPDGKLWIWDGTQNKYLSYEE